MESTTSTPRRRLLQRGAMLLGGIAGFGLLGREIPGSGGGTAAAPTGGGALSLKLHGADWRQTYPERRWGVLPTSGERSAGFGQLFSAPGGPKAGEFYASAFQFGSPFGPSEYAAASMEMHQFNLADGTIVGMGTLADFRDAESVHAIIGGTGRYDGATGSYTARQSPLELGGDGTAEFTFTINVRSV